MDKGFRSYCSNGTRYFTKMDEIVVVGYGATTKSELTGSMISIRGMAAGVSIAGPDNLLEPEDASGRTRGTGGGTHHTRGRTTALPGIADVEQHTVQSLRCRDSGTPLIYRQQR